MPKLEWTIVWYREKQPPMTLVRGATSAGNAYRRLYAEHAKLAREIPGAALSVAGHAP